MMKKYIKTLLVVIALVLTFTTVKANADVLTIDADATKYNKTNNKFTIEGNTDYGEVMVSIFDSNNTLLGLKTVSSSGGNYSAVINIIFNTDQTVTVKVGDINKTNHKLLEVDVEKSDNPLIQTLTDTAGNALTILDSLKHFASGDELDIQTVTDLDSLDDDSKQLLQAYQNKLGTKKTIIGFMNIQVLNNGNPKDLDETDNGYKLFLNIDENALSVFTKPYMARVTDPSVIGLEEGKLLQYSSDENGVVVKLNNVGIYLLYDDTSIEYKFSDDTKNQTYNLLTDDTLTYKVLAEKDKFLKLYIDDKEVDAKNYDVKSGSTIITLKKDFLKDLAVGTHTIYVDYTDGYAAASFKVISEKKSSNPLTLDNIARYGSLLVISGIGIYFGLKNIKKEKN